MSKNFLTPIVLPAGTASSAPLNLQSGTNLSAAAAGAVEYDGAVIYTTPSGRGVSPSMMFYRLNASLAGLNSLSAQTVFGVGVTLAANTVYAFEAVFTMQKSNGTISHTMSLLFGGTATVNNIHYNGIVSLILLNSTNDYSSTTASFWSSITTATLVSASNASATQTRMFTLKGTVSINTGGSFVPQYQLSAGPGGSYTMRAGSYFAIWPIGAAGANTSVGPWA